MKYEVRCHESGDDSDYLVEDFATLQDAKDFIAKRDEERPDDCLYEHWFILIKCELEYKGYHIPQMCTFWEDGEGKLHGKAIPIGGHNSEDDEYDVFTSELIVADTEENFKRMLITVVEQILFFQSIDPEDSIWYCDKPDEIYYVGDQRIMDICQGKVLNISYKYAGARKQYNYWMGEDSNIHVQVITPNGSVKHPDLYSSQDCKFALLKGIILN